jgi:CheY-like chemotaxis protein
MIASFLEASYKGVTQFALLKNERNEVLKYESIRSLSTHSKKLKLLIVPYRLVDRDVIYTYQSIVKQIRLSEDPEIASLPILVVGDGAINDEDLSVYDLCGVSFAESMVQNTWSQVKRPSAEAVRKFVDSIGNERSDRGSRHDVANKWGAFCLLYAVSITSRNLDSQLEKLIGELSDNDMYYRKLIRNIRTSVVQNSVKDILIRKKKEWDACRGKDFRVLLVEDELSIGWNDAYHAAIGEARINTASTYDEALEFVAEHLNLVILDVRLNRMNAAEKGGIQLAGKFRAKSSGMPIIACTASDKAVTLEALQKHRINAFWSKPHPDSVRSWQQIIDVGIDFYDKLIASTSWATKTHKLIDGFLNVAKIASVNSPKMVKVELSSKANSIYSLLFDEFSQNRKGIANNLQIDLAFLIAFSMINELIYWKCSEENVSATTFRLFCNHANLPMCVLEKTTDQMGRDIYEFNGRYSTFFKEIDGKLSLIQAGAFPDILVFQCLLFSMGLRSQCASFRTLKKVRNKLSITHGKVANKDVDGLVAAKFENIQSLLEIYQAMVNV